MNSDTKGPPNTQQEVAVAQPAIAFEKKKSMKEAALWSAIWEASQYMTTEQIQDYALAVLREIEADEP